MRTVNVMASGSHFEPCHFATLWAAVVEMTKGSTEPGDWSVVKL